MSKKLNTLYKDGGIDRIKRIMPEEDGVTVERALWDSIAQEPARLAGYPIKMYSIRRAKNHHPLYREPSANLEDWSFHGPWQFWAAIEFSQADDISVSAATEGLKRDAEATVWIARKELEDAGSPDPKIGDVVEFWDSPPFANVAGFQYWDIVQANPDGNVMTSETFVQWKVRVKSRKVFDPSRKIENTKI